MNRLVASAVVVVALALLGCSDREEPKTAKAAEEHAPAVTNRVDIPKPVRQNLGMTFAVVERRKVARTLRVPGAFELLPSARREYRAVVGGVVELHAQQFDRVAPGDLLYRIQSPSWRALQRELAEAESTFAQVSAKLASMSPLRAAHRRHEESLASKVDLWTGRVEELRSLRDAGGGSAKDLAEAQGTLNATQAELADVMEKDAELASRELELEAERSAAERERRLLLRTAAEMTGRSVEELLALEDGQPLWNRIDTIEVRAASHGVVEMPSTTNGAVVDATAPVLATLDPNAVRFHARCLQADIGRLRNGLPVAIVPPLGGSVALGDAMETTLLLGLAADPAERTLDVFAIPTAPSAWARAGVSGFLEITLDGGREELAVPAAAIVRDGATPVLFRRDPANPDKAIRLVADLGLSDGRWVEIKSGLRDGDQVVLDGVYPLLLATSGSAPKGGHFHSDGTFHADDH
jgi:multidrug efflux pump subunit AcrA (membrane-fusion protein)